MNKDYAESGLKLGLGTGTKTHAKTAGSAPAAKLPEKTVGYPGVPGKTQPKSRANGTPTTGHCGPFYVRKEGL